MALIFSSCEKEPVNSGNENNNNNNNQEQQGQQGQEGQQGQQETNWTYYYANYFEYEYMDYYYLWRKETDDAFKSWQTDDDPIAKIKSLRYKDADGNDIDKWSQATNDYESFVGGVSGVTTTYGYSVMFFYYDEAYTQLCAIIEYVYPGSPAAAAGLKRGDVIVKVNGNTISYDPLLADLNRSYDAMMNSSTCTITLSTGDEKTMTAVEMIENPVLLYKVFNDGDKKIGYLHYTSFTLESCPYLIEACKFFKAEGVKELILDLRYNGGGYVIAEELLMSMLAPQAAVDSKAVFEKEIYNETYGADLLEEGETGETRFKTVHEFRDDDGNLRSYSTADANIGLEKLYAIVSKNSASASEALLCCLMPFTPVVLIGDEHTYGKYTAGYIIGSDDYFNNIKNYYTQNQASLDKAKVQEALDFANGGLKYASNWGLYVMFARYADRDGYTKCMPNGIPVDVQVKDDLKDGRQLGDSRETMLRAALKNAGMNLSAISQQAPARRITNVGPAVEFSRPEKPGMVKIPTSLQERPRGPWQLPTSSAQCIQAE